MKIVITSKKPIVDDVKGRLPKDSIVDLPDHKALFYIERGEAVRYETKVIAQEVLKTDGVEAQLSVALLDQASQEKTSILSKIGVQKKQTKTKV
jgi:hypothetical protein